MSTLSVKSLMKFLFYLHRVFKQDYDWKTKLLYSLFPVLGPREKTNQYGGDPGYYREGFLSLQKAIDTLVINQLAANVTPVDIFLNRFPFPPYNDDNFVIVIQALFPFIIMLSFVFTIILTAKAITYEKETGIKEAMKLMGMKTWIYWLSWYIKTLLLVTPSVLFMIISFKVKLSLKSGGHAAILNQTDPFLLALFFFLYISSSITFTFLLTTFFKKANSAATGSGIIWFMTYLPYIFISLRYQKMSLFDKILAAFVNNLGMSEAVQLIGMFEGKGVGMQWSNINEGISVDDNFTFLQVLLILLANSFIHIILLAYLEQVRPGDHGIAKPWYFPVYFLFPKLDEVEAFENVNFNKENGNKNDTDVTSKIYIENETPYLSRKIGIRIRNLSKMFKQLGKYKQAVNKLSLNIYENHITVLLGHNGAGKFLKNPKAQKKKLLFFKVNQLQFQ
jgi:ATP-binding cassette subfamily A (ABC1) protein 3